MSMKRRVGAPAKYENSEDLVNKINEYFESLEEIKEEGVVVREQEKATITGLALYLGFASRQSLHDYKQKDEEFSYPIKRAVFFVENEYERMLQSGVASSSAIFGLKNFQWRDTTEQIVTQTNIEVSMDD